MKKALRDVVAHGLERSAAMTAAISPKTSRPSGNERTVTTASTQPAVRRYMFESSQTARVSGPVKMSGTQRRVAPRHGVYIDAQDRVEAMAP